MGTSHVGTCGFGADRQECYRAFGVVELRRTFEKPPDLATAQAWRAEAPEGFVFTLRAHRVITHPRDGCGFQDTPAVRRAWKRTIELARTLEAPLVIFETPAGFRPTDESVDSLVRFFQWAHRDRIKFGWEPRGRGWSDDMVGHLCRELSLTHVVDPFVRTPTRARPAYFRPRGNGRRDHAFGDDELARLRDHCAAVGADREVYCLFNNPSRTEDARRFLHLLGQGAPPRPVGDRERGFA
jgi:uncharacterized protein YecE (DUF72 family)